MVADSVEFLRANGRQVLFDAEHFFDGYRSNPEFALRVLEGAAQAGASHLVLCDTNGGTLPHDVERVVREVVAYFGGDVAVAVHLHDDAGTGVANAFAGVRGGATQVQGTINGYGERTGNCNLTTIIPNLTLKMGDRDDSGRPARAPHAGRASRGRAREHGPEPASPVRRLVGVRAQGRHPRQRDRPQARRVRARTPRAGRQPHARGRVGARGAQQPRDEGEGARHRARRAPAQRDGRHAEAARARGLPLRGGGRVAGAAHAAARPGGGRTGSTSRNGRSSSRTPATTSACRPRRS